MVVLQEYVVGIDFEQAKGFGINVARQGTVLYNFNAIDSWRQVKSEKLRGDNKVFRPNYSESQIHKTLDWKTSKFRALHMCFMPRSPIDATEFKRFELDGRKNPREKLFYKHKWYRRPSHQLKRYLFKSYYRNRPSFKNSTYTQGNYEVVDISNFRRPDDFRKFDLECDYVLNMICEVTDNRRHSEKNYRK